MKDVIAAKLGDIYVRRESDIIKVRDGVRRITQEMGFDATTQIKITTAVSEITRNIYEYAKSGAITLAVARRASSAGLQITARDDGPGIEEAHLRAILRGTFRSPDGMGVGLAGTRRLMDEFDIQSTPGAGTRVTIIKWLPPAQAANIEQSIEELRRRFDPDENESLIEELQQQNRDFVVILAELEEKREQLETLNRQLLTANTELSEANEKLRALAAMREEFLALTTHDLRSPLSVISGVINFFTSGRLGELTPDQKNMVAMMERNTQSLIELVNDLLDAAKLESGTMRLDHMALDLREIVGEVIDTMHPLAKGKDITLRDELPLDLPAAVGDRAQVRRIFVNLISNALKFTERGGQVTISARTEPHRIAVSVTDTGVGIPPEDVARLFDKYEQARSRATSDEKGTGLGLYITKQLVELHGGEIHAQSEPGAGSTFIFTLKRQ